MRNEEDRRSIRETFSTLNVLQKWMITLGAICISMVSIAAAFNIASSAIDNHFIALDQPKFAIIFDMLQFTMMKDGTWEAYQQHLQDKSCSEKLKSGIPCITLPPLQKDPK